MTKKIKKYFNFIVTPQDSSLDKNFYLSQFKWIIIFFLCIFNGCSSPEKSNEQLFLEHVMIRENGLFVLLGSKPLTHFSIDCGLPEIEEERKHLYYTRYSPDTNHENPSTYPNFETFNNMCNRHRHSRHRMLWNSWKKNMDKYVGKRFCFIARRNSTEDHHQDGLFINIPTTLYILKKHYVDFSEITGLSYNPEKILDEISDENSPFWKRVFDNHYLKGLLYGFGKRNAFIWDWGFRTKISVPPIQRIGQRTFDDTFKAVSTKNIDLSYLALPLFGSYAISDPQVEKYRKEKEFILQQFKRKDFFKTTLKWLSDDPPHLIEK